MKHLIYAFAILLCGTAIAQEKSKEVKEEIQVKTVKSNNGDGVKEKKIKVVTRETSDVKLSDKDAKMINQDRVKATTKIEKKIMVANNSENFKTLSKATYYMVGDKNYMFTPNNNGFEMANSNDTNAFTTIANAWITNSNGNYIIKGDTQNGIGYFDENGNFTVEYYDEDSKTIKSTIYSKDNNEMQ